MNAEPTALAAPPGPITVTQWGAMEGPSLQSHREHQPWKTTSAREGLQTNTHLRSVLSVTLMVKKSSSPTYGRGDEY